MANRVAVVTGANRGIGREVAGELERRGFSVVRGARRAGAREVALDVTDPASVAAAFAPLERVDVLVNNAGVLLYELDVEEADRSWQTNALGALHVARAAIPLMGPGGRIVNVSSQAGSLKGMTSGYAPPYSISKAALNAITRQLAVELRGDGILVNAVCPGWVRTDMGGRSASRSVQEGAASVLWAALLDEDGPTGGFFRDGRPLPW